MKDRYLQPGSAGCDNMLGAEGPLTPPIPGGHQMLGAGGVLLSPVYRLRAASRDPSTPPTSQPTMIESATGRLNQSIAELLQLKERLSATSDRLLGPVPTPAQTAGNTGDMHCDVQRLHTSLDLLESGLGELRTQVERVERL